MRHSKKLRRRKRWKPVRADRAAPIRYLVMVAVTQGGMDDAQTVFKTAVTKEAARALLRHLKVMP